MMSKRGSSESKCGEPMRAKRYGLADLKIRPDDGAFVVVGREETTCPRSAGKPHTGPRNADFSVAGRREEHTVQDPNAILTTLSQMTLKPEVKFDKLFQKLYNIE